MNYLAWNSIPTLAELMRTLDSHAKPLYWAVCLPAREIPVFRPSENAGALEQMLAEAIERKIGCLQFNAVNVLANVLPDVHLWLVPSEHAADIQTHFPQALQWQTAPIMQRETALKPWFSPIERKSKPACAIVIGAGIAGAATARELAGHGVRVTVLEAKHIANAGSGNRQGLLYAKISPHQTEQTELLLAGYGYTRRLLADLPYGRHTWGGNGVLHINFNEAEHKRNQALGLQRHHAHLYRTVSQQEAAEIAGIDIGSDGLYWPQGVWLNPPALVHALLNHPLIDVHEYTPLLSAEFDGTAWTAHTVQGRFDAGHLIYCMGAHSPKAPERNVSALPFRQIRGQTGIAAASALSAKLRCAVSGESYISPSWQGQHCYGATFVLNSSDETWHQHEESQNRAALHDLNPTLADSLFSDGLNPLAESKGHTALRCDSLDHLPMVGAVGDIAAMQEVYAKLALDKHYRLNDPCPYLPNVWLNTAHGTRGLATAPICAASLAAEILNLPQPLSPRLKAALHPNRAVIRAIARHQPLL
ncbi:FAD-dependent 5-carboxymethylaminomethyl-2-thiouridine(34) oxidoreductase MnmC [Neisseria yangbaofengii]|uniref:FAD-dependent 5-carboxymethylaminomethyl-2-thiouridine(34) oxidoreductase MnmC n=1 Tax=Neisseria yangbaofengii TaxID=2709396 RepID=UPI0013EB188C|nr:FAD-dependent 5-carboxymethylaminomethyl-2-thiouridine(34) oxidoreductase MnmC [Neisseria yangbaofengii]